MTQATINGNTYSDDGSSARDMLRYGYSDWLIPMLGDVVTVAGVVAGQAAQTAIDAASAADAATAMQGTSATSLTVSAGTKTLTTQAGKQFAAGNYVTISRPSAPSTMMHGVVTSYSGTSLVVSAATSAGSGTYTDWTIALSGPQGAAGAAGTAADIGYIAKTGAYTITAADKAKLIDCSGTFTLSFQACATLGPTWSTSIRNSGSGVVTLDPNGAETIEGAATMAINPGVTAQVHCDGTSLRVLALSLHGGEQVLHVREEKASGVAGGESVVGWQFRTPNTVLVNTIPGASLADYVITLPAGRYRLQASAAARGNGLDAKQRLALYNTTDEVTIIQGTNSGLLANGNPNATVFGDFSISSSKNLRLRHWVSTDGATNGLGLPTNTGENEVYSEIMVWRIA